MSSLRVGMVAAVGAAALLAGAARAETTNQIAEVLVTATKTPMAAEQYPGMATVIDGRELRARGVTSLREALELTAGVDAPPGGDAGPAGAVPAFWGLQEFDAFLLIVDGVPAGGAFNPALPTLDFNNIERIEVLRGSAPVTYGATSFVGVIQVFHYQPGHTPGEMGGAVGERRSAAVWLNTDLPTMGAVNQSFSVRAETRNFTQDRSGFDRFHALYRMAAETGAGRFHLDLNGVILRQDPYSPHPREGSGLSDRFPLDANVNPLDARQDQDRIQLNLGFDHELGGGAHWVTTASATRTESRNTRGFLREDFADDGVTHNADGFRQGVGQTDLYFDTYVAFAPGGGLSWTLGADWIYGNGTQHSDNFEYGVLPDGSNAPNSGSLEIDESTIAKDKRNFGGPYVLGSWQPNDRFLVSGGLRLNLTDEDQFGQVIDQHAPPGTPPEQHSDSRNKTRLSGAIGASFALWKSGADDLTVYGNYRNTYKPAAVDFGPEGEGEILEPETAESWEGGLKGRLAGGRFEWEAGLFLMDFNNLVIRENIDGLPGLANAGKERFKGAEAEARWRVTPDLSLVGTYAWHSAKFTDYARLRPDGSIQQLAGNDLELSPRNLAAAGLIYAPETGLQASAVAHYVGARWLNKGNTVKAPSYTTVDLSLGYVFEGWKVMVKAENVTDRRDPVAESELGDAQFYRLPGRTTWVEVSKRF